MDSIPRHDHAASFPNDSGGVPNSIPTSKPAPDHDTQSMRNKATFPLLSLPPELRNACYLHYLFPTGIRESRLRSRVDTDLALMSFFDGRFSDWRTLRLFDKVPDLLHVSQQVRVEAVSFFVSKAIFVVMTNDDYENSDTKVLATTMKQLRALRSALFRLEVGRSADTGVEGVCQIGYIAYEVSTCPKSISLPFAQPWPEFWNLKHDCGKHIRLEARGIGVPLYYSGHSYGPSFCTCNRDDDGGVTQTHSKPGLAASGASEAKTEHMIRHCRRLLVSIESALYPSPRGALPKGDPRGQL